MTRQRIDLAAAHTRKTTPTSPGSQRCESHFYPGILCARTMNLFGAGPTK